MAVEVLFFGQLTEKTGCSREIISNPGTIAQLKRAMEEQYAGLQNASYVVALNNRVAGEDEYIPEGAVLAFMPPYSGG